MHTTKDNSAEPHAATDHPQYDVVVRTMPRALGGYVFTQKVDPQEARFAYAVCTAALLLGLLIAFVTLFV